METYVVLDIVVLDRLLGSYQYNADYQVLTDTSFEAKLQ